MAHAELDDGGLKQDVNDVAQTLMIDLRKDYNCEVE